MLHDGVSKLRERGSVEMGASKEEPNKQNDRQDSHKKQQVCNGIAITNAGDE